MGKFSNFLAKLSTFKKQIINNPRKISVLRLRPGQVQREQDQNQYYESYCLLAPVPFGVILSARDLAIAKSKIFYGRASFEKQLARFIPTNILLL